MNKKLLLLILILPFIMGASLYAPSSINEMDDIDITGIATGKIPKWNSVTSKWEMSDDAGAASGAPTDATYLTSTANGSLSAEVNLGALSTGLLKGTVAAGVSTISAVSSHANGESILGQTFAQTQASLSIDDLITLSGVAEGSVNLGTFTGTTIADNQTNKQALQALETSLELKSPINNATMTGTFAIANNINIGGNKHKWIVSVKNGNSAITTPYIIPLGYADANLTVTQVKAATSSASYEIAGDLKYADARIGLANATVVNDFDTSSGVRSDTTITSAAIASGKFIYILFDSAPNASDTDDLIEVEWDYD